MYFKRLELLGFKSFCDKTVLNFEPGVTAVVGPNGCGKSNIFDSIRWVLGEQSAKSLRGSDMQDVIFNGTDLREPLGMAEVSLTFDNESRFFNIDNPELVITRRIFRSGESEYLLNKSTARLKDILDILMGTGVGAESYSIVAQGKIDLVLSSRPEDRRLVFDEASGITKFKSQKRETMRKLEETEQNLLRVNDIVTEVKRQISSLERQANKARRYKEVFEELKLKEVNSAVLQRRDLLNQKDGIIRQLQEMGASESNLLNIIREEEARIANRQVELRALEDAMMSAKNQILTLENLVVRNSEQVKFNREKIVELERSSEYSLLQIEQVKLKLTSDEEKLNSVRIEYDGIRQNIQVKQHSLAEKEIQINILAEAIKGSLDKISAAKKNIMDLAVKISTVKNEIEDFNSKKQIFLARNKRLEIEKAKAYEEKAITEQSLGSITLEVEALRKSVQQSSVDIAMVKAGLDNEGAALSSINTNIDDLEKQRLTLESHKEFLEKLKTKYEDIGESMNAVVYLDKLPKEASSGLVIKIKDQMNLSDEDKAYLEPSNYKFQGEAKPIELDTERIDEKINKLREHIEILKGEKSLKEGRIDELNRSLVSLQQELRTQEIALANKETSQATVQEQFNKLKEEEDIIVMELQDVYKELSVLEQNLAVSNAALTALNSEQRFTEDTIVSEEENISVNSRSREEVLVVITQIKTELEAINRRIASDEATLRILEETCSQDRESLENFQKQVNDAQVKKSAAESEIKGGEEKIAEFNSMVIIQRETLKAAEVNYRSASEGTVEIVKKIEDSRKELDLLKDKLYELQMADKDIEYKFSSIKERMIQAYKIDLDAVVDAAQDTDGSSLSQDIEALKHKLDSYGTVNLVAIEEYDELKKRYDFLIQQQSDLDSAKESLHQAILKINRITKQMFMETFEKVREEFKNYFRMLFNGGDAQVFLMDENDPLECGIEIICRPPGKKLQNVLLLSGGEKSMSAIALIFAIFKVKPSPFCILDEIDAALDEANVDRFSRVLQEFSKGSQFIVITHNKKTIANADVMYGITMQQSGVSKIVSVKFAKDSKAETAEAQVAQPVS